MTYFQNFKALLLGQTDKLSPELAAMHRRQMRSQAIVIWVLASLLALAGGSAFASSFTSFALNASDAEFLRVFSGFLILGALFVGWCGWVLWKHAKK